MISSGFSVAGKEDVFVGSCLVHVVFLPVTVNCVRGDVKIPSL